MEEDKKLSQSGEQWLSQHEYNAGRVDKVSKTLAYVLYFLHCHCSLPDSCASWHIFYRWTHQLAVETKLAHYVNIQQYKRKCSAIIIPAI